MLQLKVIRDDNKRIVNGLRKRNWSAQQLKVIQQILDTDDRRRSTQKELDDLLAEAKRLANQIGQLMGQGKKEEAEALKAKVAQLKEQTKSLEEQFAALKKQLDELLYTVPNCPHKSVPKGKTADDNKVAKAWTKAMPELPADALPHWDLAKKYKLFDFELGVKLTGAGFPVYRGKGAKLQRALIQLMLDEHSKAGFTESYLPYMLSEASLYAAGQLPKFRDNLYRDAEEDYFFIPTAEVAFVNLYRDEIIPPGQLPMRFVGHTPCFRREKMSAGRDVRGIKRGHQFEKVEMFVYCEPDRSGEELEALLVRACSIPEKLGLPYRVLALCSGDIGFNSTKTFDLEIWAPGQGEWLEVSSASNCLDFQARRANIRYRTAADAPTAYPHMLNASGLALPRTLIAVMENYQREDGSIGVPEALQSYMGIDVIPAV